MKVNRRYAMRLTMLLTLMAGLTLLSTRLRADSTGTCGGQMIAIPFTDVPSSNIFFCAIAEAYFAGLTNGTSATTYSPSDPVPREQMAAFITRTLDQSVRRSSRRAALGQWWTEKANIGFRQLHSAPQYIACDGADLWISNYGSNNISLVRASDGVSRGDYMVPSPEGIVIVGMQLFVASFHTPGSIYFDNLSNPPGLMFEKAGNLGSNPVGITCDGENLWTANFGTGPGTGSISKAPLGGFNSSTTYTAGFSQPFWILFDGSNLWVTDIGDDSLKRVDTGTGAVLQAISLGAGAGPRKPVFDGTNLWVPCYGTNQVAVVRASGGLRGTVFEPRLTGNGLSGPADVAFDGERMLVTNYNSADNTVSLWKATDLSPLGSFSLWPIANKSPTGACSDGLNFWVTLSGEVFGGDGGLAKF